jgi:hypothetical protein
MRMNAAWLGDTRRQTCNVIFVPKSVLTISRCPTGGVSLRVAFRALSAVNFYEQCGMQCEFSNLMKIDSFYGSDIVDQ